MTSSADNLVFLGDDPESLARRVRLACSKQPAVRGEVRLGFPVVEVSLFPCGQGASRGRRAAVARASAALAEMFSGSLVSAVGEQPAEALVRTLTAVGGSLAIGESCTGGLVAHSVTSVPGASAVLELAVVVYANEAKHRLLGVSRSTLDRRGAVSSHTAREMLAGLLDVGGCDCAVSTTGIAGPTGGTDDKPVGLVFIGTAAGGRVRVVKKQYAARSREQFKQIAAAAAMHQLLSMIRGAGSKT